eukprot:763353-Hanusia_phi.AAC.6
MMMMMEKMNKEEKIMMKKMMMIEKGEEEEGEEGVMMMTTTTMSMNVTRRRVEMTRMTKAVLMVVTKTEAKENVFSPSHALLAGGECYRKWERRRAEGGRREGEEGAGAGAGKGEASQLVAHSQFAFPRYLKPSSTSD